MSSKPRKRFYRKNVALFPLLEKIKLWPSRNGTLHGIRSIEMKGEYAEMMTHCGRHFMIHNSRNSRAARWLRNKWMRDTCEQCKIPGWKLEKYASTSFSQHFGANLKS